MSTRQRTKHGFTLVEILIVVVILGILAAIVIPQFTNASEAARQSGMITQLQTIRSQLELAQIQHAGVYPTLAGAATWTPMVTATEQVAAYTAGDGSGDEVGPYLQQPPINQFEASAGVVAIGAAAAGDGWAYNVATGQIVLVVDVAVTGPKLINAGVLPADLEQY